MLGLGFGAVDGLSIGLDFVGCVGCVGCVFGFGLVGCVGCVCVCVCVCVFGLVGCAFGNVLRWCFVDRLLAVADVLPGLQGLAPSGFGLGERLAAGALEPLHGLSGLVLGALCLGETLCNSRCLLLGLVAPVEQHQGLLGVLVDVDHAPMIARPDPGHTPRGKRFRIGLLISRRS